MRVTWPDSPVVYQDGPAHYRASSVTWVRCQWAWRRPLCSCVYVHHLSCSVLFCQKCLCYHADQMTCSIANTVGHNWVHIIIIHVCAHACYMWHASVCLYTCVCVIHVCASHVLVCIARMTTDMIYILCICSDNRRDCCQKYCWCILAIHVLFFNWSQALISVQYSSRWTCNSDMMHEESKGLPVAQQLKVCNRKLVLQSIPVYSG